MGTESSKLEKGGREENEEEKDEVTEVLYVSTLLDSILSSFNTELRRNFNICLKPYKYRTNGPVLDIRDATNDDIGKLTEKSKFLEANRLLVVLVPKTKVAESSDRLVVLRNPLDFSKQESAVNAILHFIRRTRYIAAGAGARAVNQVNEGAVGGIEPPPSTQPFSTAPPCEGSVHVVFGQHQQEDLLKKAVDFLRDNIKDMKFLLEMPHASSRSPSLHALSPLLVICKSEGKVLNTDVKDAVDMTRIGNDVMLLVVTDKKDLTLDKVQAAKTMGAKDRLYWDHNKKQYPIKENTKALKWVTLFLRRFSTEGVSLKRKGLFRESLKSLGKPTVSGSYHTVSSTRDNLEKSAVFFLEAYNIELTKSTQPLTSTPLVLLTTSEPAAIEEAKQLQLNHRDPQGVLLVTLQNPAHPRTSSDALTVSLLQSDSGCAIQHDLAENKKAREQIKKSLVHLKSRSGSSPENVVRPDMQRSDTADTLPSSSEGGNGSLGSSVVSTESHPEHPRSQRRRPQNLQ